MFNTRHQPRRSENLISGPKTGQASPLRARPPARPGPPSSVGPSLVPPVPAGPGAGTGAAPGHLPSSLPPFQQLLGLRRGGPGPRNMLSALFSIHHPPHGCYERRARSGVGASGGKRPRHDTSRTRLPQEDTPCGRCGRRGPGRPSTLAPGPAVPTALPPPRPRAIRTPARRRPLTAAFDRVLVSPVPGLRAAAAACRGLLLLPVLQLLLEQRQRRVVLGGQGARARPGGQDPQQQQHQDTPGGVHGGHSAAPAAVAAAAAGRCHLSSRRMCGGPRRTLRPPSLNPRWAGGPWQGGGKGEWRCLMGVVVPARPATSPLSRTETTNPNKHRTGEAFRSGF